MNKIIQKIKLFILIYLCLALLPSIIAQTTIFVSTTGSNTTGNGTLSNPYETLQYALWQCSQGDTIEMRGGNYPVTDEIRIETSDITIRSYPGEWAVLAAPFDDD
ncbi:MAG: hypothetical protein K8R53_07205, partial [Bacteroidales bacterium]|nr:hypothetical protein [Bacteroidales bacterium]